MDFDDDDQDAGTSLKATTVRDWFGTLIIAAAVAAALSLVVPWRLSKALAPEVFVAVLLAFVLFPPDQDRFSLKAMRRAALISAVAWVATVVHSWAVVMFTPRV